jgi:hypothetical protein
VPEDGRQCQQDAKLRAVLEGDSLAIDVAKPGSLHGRTLTLIVEAHGEAELAVIFGVTMTRFEAHSGALTEAKRSISVEQPSISAFGQHIEWKRIPPTPIWLANLDGSKLKFLDVSRHEFTVRLACDLNEPSCAADGDIITTALQLVTNDSSGSSNLQSEVRVQTQVQSLLSCMQTQAAVHIQPDDGSVPIFSRIHVQLSARDVDNLPVSFTRAEINLVFAGRSIPMRWSRGSSEYIADVPTEQPGCYDLVVRASNAWNETAGQATSCELLRRTITVQEAPSSSWIAAIGCIAGLAVGGLVVFVAYRIFRCINTTAQSRLAAHRKTRCARQHRPVLQPVPVRAVHSIPQGIVLEHWPVPSAAGYPSLAA